MTRTHDVRHTGLMLLPTELPEIRGFERVPGVVFLWSSYFLDPDLTNPKVQAMCVPCFPKCACLEIFLTLLLKHLKRFICLLRWRVTSVPACLLKFWSVFKDKSYYSFLRAYFRMIL